MESILNYLFAIIEPFIEQYGLLGVFIGMTIESACIPLPSEVVLPFTGYLVWLGKMSLFEAVMASTLGNLAGSLIAYAVGYWGGSPFILKYGKYIHISPNRLRRTEYWFNRYGEYMIFISRLLPGIRTFISLPAGICRMNLLRFIIFTTLGSFPWNFAFVYGGMKLGEHWEDILPIFHKLDYVSLLVIALLILLIIKKWYKKES
ncbi:DedA family protein [Candidatus Formimonas warabiya]|uniref:Alkaline phosphatase n=1 Tax=Formimonas warabiya TaxID=1761012 RepID=A0A3G1KYF4_FORW1|nr:DedA family protein [Candidatus Formimonas warabiya]ATW27245.1 alkaline phosphatase [Candidatus Formimonas warabiya]